MYFDGAAGAFGCPFCGQREPYAKIEAAEKLVLRHSAAPYHDGMFWLEGLGERHLMNRFRLVNLEKWEIRQNESYVGWRKPGEIEPREKVSFCCDNCGGTVEGFGSQNVLICPFCGSKYAKERLMETGWFTPNWGFHGVVPGENGTLKRIDDSHFPLPHYAAPFVVSETEARHAILSFAAAYPRAFADVDLERHVQNLRAVYFHYVLCDTSVVASVETEKGRALFLRDTQNWAVPASANHGEALLHDLGPWDFSALEPFTPAFCEGDVWLDRPWCNDEMPIFHRQGRDILADVVDCAEKAYGGKAYLEWVRTWDRARTRVYLPAYFLGRTEHGQKFCFAVNGQTGTVSCLGRGKSHQKRTLVREGNLDRVERSVETSLISDFHTVIQPNPKKECYKVVPPEEAFEKKRWIERWRKRGKKWK